MKEEILSFFKGEILDDESTLKAYSHDASLFEVRPKLVVYPRDVEDLKNLVTYVNEHKTTNPELSLTIRAAGSCMSGGSLNESIIADVSKYMNKIGKIDHTGPACVVEPGVFYRDFELQTLDKKLILPCFPASKNLAALGGMISNNCAGEKTLRWGKIENFVLETKVIFTDGKEYVVKPLSKAELLTKMEQEDFEGDLYKKIYNLLESNKQLIQTSKPDVSKNSAGYYLWNVRSQASDNGEEMFDLNKLLVGSQGTLGIITEAKLKLVPVEPITKLYVLFLPNLSKLAELVNVALPTNPDSIESYDDATLKLAMRFFPEMLKSMKVKHFIKLILSFIPEAWMILKRGLPKLVVLIEYSGKTEQEVDDKLDAVEALTKHFGFLGRKTHSEEEASKYWTVRRESFNLLRKHVAGKRTAPFVDDVVIKPEHMPEFLPKMRSILDSYKLTYTIAGHAGNGNFHIIPLMDMKDKKNVQVIKEVGDKVYDLVAEYKGSITAEHNDGIVRTPYLNKMYSPEVLDLFKQTKDIFDPQNILNPGKKVPSPDSGQAGTLEYMESHLVRE